MTYKNKYLTIFLVSFFFVGFADFGLWAIAQSQTPTVQTGPLHSVITIAGPNYIALEECGDTLIEGVLYQKLWQSEYDYPSFNLQGGYEFAYTRTNKDSVFIRQKTLLDDPFG